MNAQSLHTCFGLMRHAPTQWNEQKRIQGIRDSDLTPEGRRLAERWGRQLAGHAWDRILTSDLGRARQTAELVNGAMGIDIEVLHQLREMDWGEWTGITLKGVRSERGAQLVRLEKQGWSFRPPGGESRYELWRRANRALCDAAVAWPGQRLLVITHEGVIKALIYRLCHRHYLPTERPILKGAHLHWLIHRSGALHLKTLNALYLQRSDH